MSGTDRPASEELPRHGQPGAISVEPVHSEEAENDVHDKVDGEVAEIVEVADPATSGGTGIDGTAVHDAARIKRTAEVAPREQRSRSKEAVAIANDPEVILQTR